MRKKSRTQKKKIKKGRKIEGMLDRKGTEMCRF